MGNKTEFVKMYDFIREKNIDWERGDLDENVMIGTFSEKAKKSEEGNPEKEDAAKDVTALENYHVCIELNMGEIRNLEMAANLGHMSLSRLIHGLLVGDFVILNRVVHEFDYGKNDWRRL
jgi:hypothetical protein